MEAFQRTIEDERKARFTYISQHTKVGSLGCGLTMSWTDWLGGEDVVRPTEVSRATLSGFVTLQEPTKLFMEREPSGTHWEFDIRGCLATNLLFPSRGGSGSDVNEPSNRSITFTERRSPVGALRERELEWRRTHARELSQYANQWVVLEGEEVVAHGRDAAQAIRQAKARGIRTPYVFFVEPESDDSVKIGL